MAGNKLFKAGSAQLHSSPHLACSPLKPAARPPALQHPPLLRSLQQRCSPPQQPTAMAPKRGEQPDEEFNVPPGAHGCSNARGRPPARCLSPPPFRRCAATGARMAPRRRSAVLPGSCGMDDECCRACPGRLLQAAGCRHCRRPVPPTLTAHPAASRCLLCAAPTLLLQRCCSS